MTDEDKKPGKPKRAVAARAPGPCPTCGKPATPKFRPFCSDRCKTIDLGRWLGGDYRIPSEDEPDVDDVAELMRHLEDGAR